GAGDAVASVQDEERHGVDAVPGGLFLVGAYGVGVPVLAQRAPRVVPVKARLGGQVGEVVVAADVATFDEVRAHQAFLDLQLPTVGPGVVEELVGRAGVGVPDRAVVVGQPDLRGHLDHVVDHLAGPGGRDALAADKVVERAAVEVDRRVRVQLEAVVLQPYPHIGVALGERGRTGLEPALADVAPGADHVRPHVDLDHLGHGLLPDPSTSVAPRIVRGRPDRGRSPAALPGRRSRPARSLADLPAGFASVRAVAAGPGRRGHPLACATEPDGGGIVRTLAAVGSVVIGVVLAGCGGDGPQDGSQGTPTPPPGTGAPADPGARLQASTVLVEVAASGREAVAAQV